MSDKPEALRLANALQQQAVWESHYGPSYLRDLLPEAAAELRRQHAECEALRLGVMVKQQQINGFYAGTSNSRLLAMTQERDRLHAECERLQADATFWESLYRRAVNEANGLTNYVEDRPELRAAERKLTAIELEARTYCAPRQP